MSDQPQTASGRALDSGLAYDTSPESYLPGDYFQRYRTQIVAIEREAQSLVLDALEAAVRRLDELSDAGPGFVGGYGQGLSDVLEAIQQQRSKP